MLKHQMTKLYTCLIFVAVIAFGAGSPLLGKSRCALGPSYWCADISAARDCGAVGHCIATVWKHAPVPDVASDGCCGKCQRVIARLRNMTIVSEKQVVDILDSACDALPDDKLRQECKSSVKTYIKDVLDMIITKMDPKQICTLIRLCKKSLKKSNIIQSTITKSSTEKCELCKLAVMEVKAFISKKDGQTTVIHFIQKLICSHLGAKASQCNDAVEEYANTIFLLLQEELDPSSFCEMVHVCSSEHGKTAAFGHVFKDMSATPSGVDARCAICEFAMRELDNLLKENRTEKVILYGLEKACSFLPTNVSKECASFVDEYAQVILQLLIQELAPAQVCTALGICNGQRQQQNMAPKEQPLKFSPFLMRGEPMMVQQPAVKPPQAHPKSTKKLKVSVQCVMCEYAMSKLKDILVKNATVDEIVSSVDRLCSLLPVSLSKDCNEFVDEYGPVIVQLLLADLAPEHVCAVLGFCRDTSVPVITTGEICETCEIVMMYMDNLLKENSTEHEFDMLLSRICNFLPSSFRGECDSLVDEFLPQILELLINKMSPKYICAYLKLCKKHSHQTLLKRLVPAKIHLVGTKSCLNGPSYWCKNMHNAKECNVVDHCSERYWN